MELKQSRKFDPASLACTRFRRHRVRCFDGHGVAGSLLLSQLIAGETCPWVEFYDPSRISLSAAKTFIAENITAVKNFAEYIAPGELKSVDELKPGKGAIVREGLRKIAAFRDDNESGAVMARHRHVPLPRSASRATLLP
jgi:hypothetical protein